MPVRRFARFLSMATAALLLGAGAAVVVAVPANAATVTDTTSLNDAIAAAEPILDIANDFTLTADLSDINYDVQIVGNGHTIDADGFDAFDISASATVTGLTVDDAAETALGIYLPTGGTAIVTDFSSTGAGSYGIYLDVPDGASAAVSGGTQQDTGTAIFASASGTSSVTVTDTAAIDADYGYDLFGNQHASLEITRATATAGPNHNAGYSGYGFYFYTQDSATVTADGITATSNADTTLGAWFYGIETYEYDANTIDISNATTTHGYYGLYVDVYDSEGTFILSDSTFSDAAYYNIYLCDLAGTGTLSGLTVTGGGDEGPVAGLYADNYGGTPLTISDSTFSGNAAYGLYIQNYDDDTSFTLIDSTVSGNGDGNNHPGIQIENNGASTSTIRGSTISGNTDGGLWLYLNDESNGSVVNSTISGNTAGAEGWAFWTGGDTTGEFQLLDSTVTDNTGIVGAGFEDHASLISHSIIAGNHIDSSAGYGELWIENSTEVDVTAEWSLLGDVVDDSSGSSYTQNAGVTTGVTNPGLGPLADNGGPTLTHKLLSTSLALDAGNPAISGAPATDQRGHARIQGSAIDLGAYESDPMLAATGVEPAGPATGALVLLMLGAAFVVARGVRRRTV